MSFFPNMPFDYKQKMPIDTTKSINPAVGLTMDVKMYISGFVIIFVGTILMCCFRKYNE